MFCAFSCFCDYYRCSNYQPIKTLQGDNLLITMSQQNRKVVLVGEVLHSAKAESNYATKPATKLVDSKEWTDHLDSPEPQVSSVPTSPVESGRSSRSSLLGVASNVSGFVASPTPEHRILEELRKEIVSTSARIKHLEEQVAQIPSLNAKIEEVEKQRGSLSYELLDQQEVVKSLKQRVSILHEQNGQLATLVQAEKGGNQEILAMRNALVASLAQLKQLQEQNNSIPALKSQVSTLLEENRKLKKRDSEMLRQFSVQLPEGVEPTDYIGLLEQNSTLTNTNQKLMNDLKVVEQHLVAVSAASDGLKKRMEMYEVTRAQVAPLQERIKQLVVEKRELQDEILEMKFNPSHCQDIDVEHLTREVGLLQKSNRQLQSKMEQMRMQTKQQKEQLILKLFDIEGLNVKAHKYELEKQVLAMQEMQATSDSRLQLRMGSLSPDLDLAPSDVDDLDMPGALSEVRVQMLKLQQLKVHSEQSRNLVQILLADREEVERNVVELNRKLEERGTSELDKELKDTQCKLKMAREKIATLESRLDTVVNTSTSHSALVVENKNLSLQLTQLKSEYQRCCQMQQACREMEEKLHDHNALAEEFRKLKEEKHKSDKKLKGSKDKLRSLAKELACSVQLLKDYQGQCMALNEQLEKAQVETEVFREQCALAKAQLEVKEAESTPVVPSSITANESSLASAEQVPLQKRFDDLLLKWEAEKNEVSILVTKLSTVTAERDHLNTATQNTEADLLKIKALQLKTCNERDSLKQEIELQLQAEANLQSHLQKLQTENTELSNQVRQLHQAAEEKHEMLQLSTTENESLKRQMLRLEQSESKHIDLLQSDLKVAEKELETRKSETKRLLGELQQKENEITMVKSTMENEYQILQTEMRHLKERSTQLLHDTEGKTRLLESECEAHRQKMDNLQEELIGVRSELEKMERSDDKVATEVAEQQTVVSAMQQSALVQCPPSHELKQLVKVSQEKVQVLECKLSELQKEHAQLLLESHKDKENSMQLQTQLQLLTDKSSLKVQELQETLPSQVSSTTEHEEQRQKCLALTNELEGYKAMISSLRRQLDEAETREMEHEMLKLKIQRLEKTLLDSSQLKLDNKALYTMMQEALTEMPSFSNEANRFLQEENLRLEQQVSVLSQWNDKQRLEIEALEQKIDNLGGDNHQLLTELMSKENYELENCQLKQELKEVEVEVNSLRRQVRADLQEEVQVKLETQSHLLSLFNQHNTSLQKQVLELQDQIRSLGGMLDREKPVSPPPMPDIALSMQDGTAPLLEGGRLRALSGVEKENELLKQRISKLEGELIKMQDISASVRRRSSTLSAVSSLPLVAINEDMKTQ